MQKSLNSSSVGFTLVELVVVIAIAAILMMFAYAPYNFYANKSRVRLSSERIEQAMSKAKLMASTGYSPNGNNVDIVVHLALTADSVQIESVPASGSRSNIPLSGNANRKMIESVPLDSQVILSGLFGTTAGTIAPAITQIDLVYRSPTGSSEVWDASNGIATNIPLSSVVGGVIGIKGVTHGVLSRNFTLKK